MWSTWSKSNSKHWFYDILLWRKVPESGARSVGLTHCDLSVYQAMADGPSSQTLLRKEKKTAATQPHAGMSCLIVPRKNDPVQK